MARHRTRKQRSNAPQWTERLLADALVVAGAEFVAWAAAFYAHDRRNEHPLAWSAADALRTRQMLSEIVRAAARHQAEQQRLVRDVRVALLLPELVRILKTAAESTATPGAAAEVEKLFRTNAVSITNPEAKKALLELVRRQRLAKRVNITERSVAGLLYRYRVTSVGYETLANYRYAKEDGTKRRQAAAVRNPAAVEALRTGCAVEHFTVVQFAVRLVARYCHVDDEETIEALASYVFEHIDKAAPPQRGRLRSV